MDEEEKAADAGSVGAFLEEKAFRARTVLVFGQITDTLAGATVGRLIALSSASDAPINLLVSSPGGHVESGDAIHDMIRFVRAPVTTVGTGWVASAGAHIFLGAEKQNRFCLPNTRFLLHQPLGGVTGQASDITIEAEEIIKMRERINRIIARETDRLTPRSKTIPSGISGSGRKTRCLTGSSRALSRARTRSEFQSARRSDFSAFSTASMGSSTQVWRLR